MISPRRLRGVGIAHLITISLLSPGLFVIADQHGATTRNAVFNGDFTEGVAAWSKLGPGHAAADLSVEKSQFAHVLINDLIVSAPGMVRTFSVYSPYLLNVRPDRRYTMTVQASGVGHISFGAFEYDEGGHHIGNIYSPRYVLTNELQTYTFACKPTRNARGIRPSIAFLEATDGSAMDVRARIRRVEIPVAADEFGQMCESWPDYAKENRFAGYEGFSPVQRAALEALGEVQDVLPPYKPIRANKLAGSYSLTTSQIVFDERALPQRVSILGEPVLAAPMELSLNFSDGAQLRPMPPEVHASDTRVEMQQELGPATAKLELHYDALMIYTVELANRPGVSISNASLSIPLRGDIGKYIRYQRLAPPSASGYGDWVYGYGPIPRRGESVKTKAVVGSAHSGNARANDWQPPVPDGDGTIWQWNRGFVHTIWIGDETRGVSLFVPSTRGYHAKGGDVTAQLVRRGDEVRLTYRFITDDVSLDQPRTIQFALQLMPPKPAPRRWFAARFSSFFSGYASVGDPCLDILDQRQAKQRPAYGHDHDVVRQRAWPADWQPKAHRPYRDTGFLWYTLWAQGSRGWLPDKPVGGCSTPLVGHPRRLARMIEHARRLGHRGLPYFAATHIAAEDPAGYFYVERRDEWTHHPRIPRPAYLRPTCPNSLFSAYMARGIGRLIDDYDIPGVYFDNCAPQLCANTKHGCGYVDDEGNVHATLPLLGYRKLFEMVRRQFIQRGREPYIMTHAGLHPAVVSFVDVELQGEGTYGSDHTQMFSLGEWRAAWLGLNQFGVQLSYLPSFGYGLGPSVDRGEQQVIGTPRLLAMSLLHGTHVWNQYIDSPLLYRAWSVLDELDEPDIEFVPYWQWRKVNVALNRKEVYASAYRGKTRTILVLSNLSDRQQTVTIPVAGGVEDHMHGLPAPVEDGKLTCTIAAKNFRLLSVTVE